MISHVPILTFHSVDDSGSVISMAPSRFTYLLKVLKRKGYQTISLNDVIQWLAGEKVLPPLSVVITFDDGFENLYLSAFPVLEELSFRATLFLSTGYCDRKNNWPTQDPSIPLLQMLNWGQLAEMATSVFDIQAHTRTHPFLPSLPPEQLRDELVGSKTDIEQHLGKPVNFFAYPYGYFHQSEDVWVRQIFQGACSTSLTFVSRKNDPYLLPRIDMYYFSHQITSKIFLSSLFRPYLRFRRFLRLLRQQC